MEPVKQNLVCIIKTVRSSFGTKRKSIDILFCKCQILYKVKVVKQVQRLSVVLDDLFICDFGVFILREKIGMTNSRII